jgi:hypothetical protein
VAKIIFHPGMLTNFPGESIGGGVGALHEAFNTVGDIDHNSRDAAVWPCDIGSEDVKSGLMLTDTYQGLQVICGLYVMQSLVSMFW